MFENLGTVRNASHLLPTGGSLVRDLAYEIELLRRELEQRDEFVDQQLDRLDNVLQRYRCRSDSIGDWRSAKNQLVTVRDENRRIHKDLRKAPTDE